MKNNITKINIKKMQTINWGIDNNLANLINEIDIMPKKRVLFTAGERQYVSDDGQMYQVQTKSTTNSVPISKFDFIERTNEYKISQYNKNIKT